MNVFLTGGTGLIGRTILNKINISPFVLCATFRNHKIEDVNVNWVRLDASKCSQYEINQLVEKQDIIIHNAASLKLGNSLDEIKEIQKINIEFTEKLLEASVKQNIKKFIFTSTLSSIKKPLPKFITEESEINPISFYSKSKIECEQLIKKYADENKFNYCILRVSSPVSDFEFLPNNVLKKWISLGLKNQRLLVFGNGSRTQDFVSVNDIASAIFCSIEKIDVNGVFNIASGNSISMYELAQLISEKFNNGFENIGIDENEEDRWNISIEKAKNELNYMPKYTSIKNITNLLEKINK
jgi:UDP-glucose 4-epimerase